MNIINRGYYSRAALIFCARAMCGYYSRAATIRCAATIRINTVGDTYSHFFGSYNGIQSNLKTKDIINSDVLYLSGFLQFVGYYPVRMRKGVK